MPSTFASIILDQGIDKPLDYTITPEVSEKLAIGSRVLVPLQNTFRKGTVVAVKAATSVKNPKAIKELLSEESLLSSDLLNLAHWMSEYYCCPLRKVLRSLLPATIRKEVGNKQQLFVKPLISLEKLKQKCSELRLTAPAQAHTLDIVMKHKKGILLSKLLEEGKISKSPIDTLVKHKILSLQKVTIDRSPLEDMEFFQSGPKILNPEQAESLKQIQNELDSKKFHTHLIHGITGSGKTEVYMQAIEYARKQNKSVILLVPEIALTSQTIERLKSRFTEKLGILHHRLSDGERYDIWHSIREGKISIIVGARSAIFSPAKNLGLIIVDEEHESSYKQTEEEPCYHARDVAVMRAHLLKATVVLGSATPSVETFFKAKEGKYHLSTLNARATSASLPKIHLIDMRKEYEKAGGFKLFSDPLIQGIKSRFELGEQTLLFLNRRGYHSFQLCSSCGKPVKCPHCDVSLTYHKKSNHLACHLCPFTLAPPPSKCPHCNASSTLKFKGVGTEQVERTLHALLPEIRTLRMDADTTRHKGSHDALFKQFRSGKADILIGTQMIAKGLHFPAVTLVGVLNTDGALNLPDFRSSETVFQLLTQVSGRAGRGELAGEVMIQTSLPTHPIFSLAANENYEGFFEEEKELRKLFEFPPYCRLVKLTFSGLNENDTSKLANSYRELLIKHLPSTFHFYPIIPSGYAKIKDRYRFKLVIKGQKIYALSHLLARMRRDLPLPKGMKLLIDVDPTNLFN